uniref:Putative guanylate-binding protein n=1 Tax=Amblyomma triste TaxID=251400 RepID=A0A023GC07_AMBTT
MRDWLDDKSIPLGGFKWRAGSEPHTTGILLWNQPFVITTPQGEEVAVLLMDTQGSFDSNSSVKECTTIFALSAMMSSVLVYNIFRNVQEDHLQHLQFFAEYGKMALKAATKTVFQRIVFLVSDWPFAYEAEYGAVGGKAILEKRLKITDDQQTEQRDLRQQILSTFSQTDCFLMPHPGDKVQHDPSFNGRLEDIDNVFMQKIQEFVPWILSPESVVVKEINGQKITCQNLLHYFKVYAKAFQGGALPEPKSLLEATVEASHESAKEKAVKFYIEGLKTLPRGDLDKMVAANKLLKEETIEMFRTAPKVGDERALQKYLTDLEQGLHMHFCLIYTEEQLSAVEKERKNMCLRERQEIQDLKTKIDDLKKEIEEHGHTPEVLGIVSTGLQAVETIATLVYYGFKAFFRRRL